MSSWQTLSILDPGPLTEAFGDFGEDARKTLALFLASTRPLLARVESCLQAGDLAGAEAAAHSAKGAANVSGAFRLGGLCAEICARLRRDEPLPAHELAARLPDALAEVQKAIAAL